MRLGVYGGAFDPPHNAHLSLARYTVERKALDRLILVPTFIPSIKGGDDLAPFIDRHRMVELATESFGALIVSDMEGRRGGTSYTLDTLREVRRAYEVERGRFFLLIGSDALLSLRSWRAPDEILREADVLVLKRPGFPPEEAAPEVLSRVEILNNSEIDISSSDVRRRIANGLPVGHLVPKNVAAYISERGIYAAGRN